MATESTPQEIRATEDSKKNPSPDAVSSAYGKDEQLAYSKKTPLKYPNLGSSLNDMAVRVEEGEAKAEEAAADAPLHRGKSVAVTIHLSGNQDEIFRFLTERGGDPRNVGEDYIEAYVPVALLGQLSERPGVIRVREVVPPQPGGGG